MVIERDRNKNSKETLKGTSIKEAVRTHPRTITISWMWSVTSASQLRMAVLTSGQAICLDGQSRIHKELNSCWLWIGLIEPIEITNSWNWTRSRCPLSIVARQTMSFSLRKVVKGSSKDKRVSDKSKLNGCKVSRRSRDHRVHSVPETKNSITTSNSVYSQSDTYSWSLTARISTRSTRSWNSATLRSTSRCVGRSLKKSGTQSRLKEWICTIGSIWPNHRRSWWSRSYLKSLTRSILSTSLKKLQWPTPGS